MSLRLRLAILMALGLLVTGSVALAVNAVTYEDSLVHSLDEQTKLILEKLHIDPAAAEAAVRANPELIFTYRKDRPIAPGQLSVNQAFQEVQRDAQREAVRRSRISTAAAVGVLALLTAAIGWLIAGRALKPVRLISRRAQSATAENLSARVSLEGPDDEIKGLADTFDSMLDRLETSFAAQQRFAAQASHELRTPLAVIRSETDLLLAEADDGDPTQQPIENIRTATLRAERIVTTLLALERTESRSFPRQEIMLDELVGDVIADAIEGAEWRDLRVDVELRPAQILGDRALIESLVRNLADNAARHNRRDGWVRFAVRRSPDGAGDHAVLEVSNASSAEIGDTVTPGIGLTLVEAIVDAHGGRLEQHLGSDTMTMTVHLPPPARFSSARLATDRAPGATDDAPERVVAVDLDHAETGPA